MLSKRAVPFFLGRQHFLFAVAVLGHNQFHSQQRCERAVQFVAESATPLLDDLVDEGVLVDDNFASEGDIEILKGNSHQVSMMDGAKCVGSGRSGTE